MGKEVFVGLFFVGALFGFFFWHRIKQFFRWLKGSRVTYYFPSGHRVYPKEIHTTSKKIRKWKDMDGHEYRPNGSVIEINRGIFRCQSTIYGPAAKNWKIVWAKSFGGDPPATLARISFQDCQGLSESIALQTISTYSSLQAMLNRISELENGHKLDEAKFQMMYAAVVALRFQILSDKQRYRSPAAKEIREDLDMVIEKINTLLTDRDSLKVWSERFQEHRLQTGQPRADYL